MDLTTWTCLDCHHRFQPANVDGDNPCPACGSDAFPVVPVREITEPELA